MDLQIFQSNYWNIYQIYILLLIELHHFLAFVQVVSLTQQQSNFSKLREASNNMAVKFSYLLRK